LFAFVAVTMSDVLYATEFSVLQAAIATGATKDERRGHTVLLNA
jgi:hypothetical protein